MNAAMKNAKRLVDDAKLLLRSQRYPSACSLAILAIEEGGKLSALRTIAGASGRRLKDAWRGYRDHQTKNAAWIIGELAAKGARTLDDLKPIFDPDSDHPAVLDALKQIAFYTDCYGNGHWSQPDAVIDQGLTETLVRTAEAICSSGTTTTAREIELWIQHVGRVWGTPQMRAGLLAFYSAMEIEGLTKHARERLEEFLGERLPGPRAH